MERSRRQRWIGSRTAGLLVVFGLLAACGGDDGGSAAPGGDGTGTDGGNGETVSDATFRYPYFTDITSFDPHRTRTSNDTAILEIVYDSLLERDEEGLLAPGLATSYDIEEDGQAVTLELRPDVEFSNGEAFDAEVAKVNIDRQLDIEESVYRAELQTVEAVEAVDDLTLRIELSSPAALPLLFALSDRSGMMIAPSAVDAPDLATVPVGSGPYNLTTYLPGDRFEFERSPTYWDFDGARVARLHIPIIVDSNTTFSALRAGEVDAARITPQQLPQAESAGFQIHRATGLTTQGMLMNNGRPCLEDVRARTAVNHAINREAIVEGLLGGFAAPTSQTWPEEYAAYSPDVPPDYFNYDPDLAQELLDEAGLLNACSFTIQTWPADAALCEVIQSQLAEVTIDVDCVIIERELSVQAYSVDQVNEAFIWTSTGLPDPTTRLSVIFHTEGRNNPGGGGSAEIDALLDEAAVESDIDRRFDLLREVMPLAAEQALLAFLYHPESILAYSDEVQNLRYDIGGRELLRDVSMSN